MRAGDTLVPYYESMKQRQLTWKRLIEDAVATMPVTFSLSDVLAKREAFAKHYPQNRFVDAKIRQSLQILRNQGTIQFLGNGLYRRLDVSPRFSPLIDETLAAQYAGATQIARIVLETWAELNLYCLRCDADALDRLPENTPVADFECLSCTTRYQLKAKNGRFGTTVSGAAYAPTVKASSEGSMPEYVLVEYDRRFSTVVFVDALPGRSITPERIIPRRKLSASARRAGWQGCNINIDGIDRVAIVRPAGIAQELVRSEWLAMLARSTDERC